jgi:hypothetical protein
LDQTALHSSAGSPHKHAESGSCFALPVAGVNHQQTLRTLAIVLTPPLVPFFFCLSHLNEIYTRERVLPAKYAKGRETENKILLFAPFRVQNSAAYFGKKF